MNRYKINMIKKFISTQPRYDKNIKNIVNSINFNKFQFKKNNELKKNYNWLNDPTLKNKIKKMEKENKINYNDFVCISDKDYKKPTKSLYFKKNIEKMGEHSISYMEKLNNFKDFYNNYFIPVHFIFFFYYFPYSIFIFINILFISLFRNWYEII